MVTLPKICDGSYTNRKRSNFPEQSSKRPCKAFMDSAATIPMKGALRLYHAGKLHSLQLSAG